MKLKSLLHHYWFDALILGFCAWRLIHPESSGNFIFAVAEFTSGSLTDGWLSRNVVLLSIEAAVTWFIWGMGFRSIILLIKDMIFYPFRFFGPAK